MKLFIVNPSTVDQLSYLGGALAVNPGDTVEVPADTIKDLGGDADFIVDLGLNNIFLSDGSVVFKTWMESRTYLRQLTANVVNLVGKNRGNLLDVDSLNRLRTSTDVQVSGNNISPSNPLPAYDILQSDYITAEKTATSTRSPLYVGVDNLLGRKHVEIINTGNVVLYVGSDTVTTTGSTRGRPVNPRGSYRISVSDAVTLYIISASSCPYVIVEGA